MSSKPIFPPNVVIHIKQEIERRTAYRVKLEKTPPHFSDDDFMIEKTNAERANLQQNIDAIYDTILSVTKRHFPGIEIDPNPDVTIANILAALPPPEELVRVKVLEGLE